MNKGIKGVLNNRIKETMPSTGNTASTSAKGTRAAAAMQGMYRVTKPSRASTCVIKLVESSPLLLARKRGTVLRNKRANNSERCPCFSCSETFCARRSPNAEMAARSSKSAATIKIEKSCPVQGRPSTTIACTIFASNQAWGISKAPASTGASMEARKAVRARLEYSPLDELLALGAINDLLPETIEFAHHPWFVGVQYHPELKSKPFDPHPLFAFRSVQLGSTQRKEADRAARLIVSEPLPGAVGTPATAIATV